MSLSEHEHGEAYRYGHLNTNLFLKNVIVGPQSIIYDLIIIYTYCKVKSFRKKPGDIIVMIAVNDIFTSLFLIIAALNSQHSP